MPPEMPFMIALGLLLIYGAGKLLGPPDVPPKDKK